jgi:Ca2+/H+ antiporter, TMEM165/GDT1 family
VTSSQAGLLAAVFLASAVEFVEAFTIVLAMGVTRGWRSAIWGAVAAAALLGVVTAVAGYALVQWVPEDTLRIVIGGLLLAFGLQWLRKAVLRAAGRKALHDEEEAFQRESEAAAQAGADRRLGLDWVAFAVSFKAVLLEGVEVVFIVITFGANADSVPLAAAGAAAACAVVVSAGAMLRHPLSRVPENTIKFTVGLLLTTFGTFWLVEGLGGDWPGDDLALPGLLALWLAASRVAIAALRRREPGYGIASRP